MYQMYFIWFTVYIFIHHNIRAESIRTNGKSEYLKFPTSLLYQLNSFLLLVAITSHYSYRSSSLLDFKLELTFQFNAHKS